MRKGIVSAFIGLLLICASAWAASKTRVPSLQIGGGTVLTGTQGNSGIVQQAGTTSSSPGIPFCTDANKNTTTSGCGYSQVLTAITTSVCTTSGASYASCTTTLNWPGTGFVDSGYGVSCSGITATNFPYIGAVSKSSSNVTVTIYNGTSNGSMASTYAEVDCIGIHP
jgi:hypothetical protein